MNLNELDDKARQLIAPGSDLVRRHMDALRGMVAVDSRSFGVNEFPGDRKTPSDMRDILALAAEYLRGIGFSRITVNESQAGEVRWANPILMAEIVAGADKPTLLCYAHLDKQPYMDDGSFGKWGGVAPTELRWNADGSRAYGRGAADDLAGVTSIGLAVEALLRAGGCDAPKPSEDQLACLPCNFKIIYETEEESGSHTLIEQIEQNRDFFAASDCVIITDVINPASGCPGLTTSLRGIAQCVVEMRATGGRGGMDAQTALYKMLASLIHEDHALAVEPIAADDRPLTEEERDGYARVPTSVEALRRTAGLLPATRLTVPEDKTKVIEAQLRKSFANVRPGHRVAGSVIFGAAGARLSFKTRQDVPRERFRQALTRLLNEWNRFGLALTLKASAGGDATVFDLILQSATQDPHSGIHGGPFPVAELQLAQMIDRLIGEDGCLNVRAGEFAEIFAEAPAVTVRPLRVDDPATARPFDNPTACAVVEIRLAPGNDEATAGEHLRDHLQRQTPAGFDLQIIGDKGASPWITDITHPVFPLILEALETGYQHKACLYGCGGSIPFVPKLTGALGGIPPLCLGAYDPESRMHEPGESLSLVDWLGCSRAIVRFATRSPQAFPPTT